MSQRTQKNATGSATGAAVLDAGETLDAPLATYDAASETSASHNAPLATQGTTESARLRLETARIVSHYLDASKLGRRAANATGAAHSRRCARSKLDTLARCLAATFSPGELAALGVCDARSVSALDIPWHRLTPEILSHAVALLSASLSLSTVAATVSHVRGLLRSARLLELLDAETFWRLRESVEIVASASSDTLPAWTEANVERLLDAADADELTARGARDALLVSLLCDAGLRRAEALALSVADVELDARLLHVRATAGKGHKARAVPLDARLARRLVAWLAERGSEPGALLCPVSRHGTVNARDEALCNDAARRMVGELGQRAGVASEELALHGGRRHFATSLHRAGADVVTISKLLGHAQIQTTLRYVDVNEDAKRGAIDKRESARAARELAAR